MRPSKRCSLAHVWLAALTFALLCAMVQAQAQAGTVHLRVIGGLADVPQFARHEEPFWTRELPRLTQGRLTAEIIPFQRAGIGSQDMLRLLRSGVVPFATTPISGGVEQDASLAAADLAGLNPGMAGLRRNVDAFRPMLRSILRERHGVELLAVYSYPAQVLFCRQSFRGLKDLVGRRIRVSALAQADFLEALGARPVITGFSDIVPNLRKGHLDCAVTGSLSGHAIGLHELTSHVHTLPLSWGVAMFGANLAAWQALPADLRELLRGGLAGVERAVWDESERNTEQGLACVTGQASCTQGRPGRMVMVTGTADDEATRRRVLAESVTPRWRARCGADCDGPWTLLLKPLTADPGRSSP